MRNCLVFWNANRLLNLAAFENDECERAFVLQLYQVIDLSFMQSKTTSKSDKNARLFIALFGIVSISFIFFFSVSLNIKIQFDKSVFCTLIIIYLKLVNNFGVDWIVDWQQFFQPFNNDRECASENERQQPKRNWCSCIHQTLDDARVTHINQIQTNRR